MSLWYLCHKQVREVTTRALSAADLRGLSWWNNSSQPSHTCSAIQLETKLKWCRGFIFGLREELNAQHWLCCSYRAGDAVEAQRAALSPSDRNCNEDKGREALWKSNFLFMFYLMKNMDRIQQHYW